MSEKLYVVGFAFNEAATHVVLVHKDRPEWQKGLINGVGGKIEDFDNSYAQAMAREFKEETGLFTVGREWQHFATLHFGEDKLGGEAMVFAFRMFNDEIRKCKTTETEKIEIFEIAEGGWKGFNTLEGLNFVPHAKILLQAGMYTDFKFIDFKMK